MPTVSELKKELDELKVEYDPKDNKSVLEEKLEKAKEASDAPSSDAPAENAGDNPPAGEGASESASDSAPEGDKDKNEEGAKGLKVNKNAKISAPAKEAKVYSKAGQYIRTYSLEIHGKDYAKLAAKFAGKEKVQGSVR